MKQTAQKAYNKRMDKLVLRIGVEVADEGVVAAVFACVAIINIRLNELNDDAQKELRSEIIKLIE